MTIVKAFACLAKRESSTMTDQPKRQPASRRNAKSSGAVWKSGLLALSLVTVVSGTSLLGRAEGGQQTSGQATAQTAQQVVVVQQLPSGELLVRQDCLLYTSPSPRD